MTPKMILNNLAFRFEFVYVTLRNIVLFMIDDPRGTFKSPYDVGYGLGTSAKMIIVP